MAGSSDAYLNGGLVYPEDNPTSEIYRNIEGEPLIKRIKNLEKQLPDNFAKKDFVTSSEKKILNGLLRDFKQLLKTKYGSLGYLTSTTAEDIIHLYGVDTENDFMFLDGGSSIRLPNKRLDPAVAIGGGKRWIGERGLLIADPEEDAHNLKLTDDAINEIIQAIEKKLSGAA